MARPIFEDLPSTNTPINATNLNILGNGVANIGTSVDSSYNTNLIKSKNLFDENITTNLWSQYGTGVITNVANANLQRFNCEAGDTFTLSATFSTSSNDTVILIAFYDINGNVLDRTTQNTTFNLTKTAPTNTAYMYAGHYTIKPTQIMLNKGDEALDYEAFVPNSIYVNEEKFTETIGIGTNVNSANRVNVIKYDSSNIFTTTGATTGSNLTDTGSVNTNAPWGYTDYIEVYSGKALICSSVRSGYLAITASCAAEKPGVVVNAPDKIPDQKPEP